VIGPTFVAFNCENVEKEFQSILALKCLFYIDFAKEMDSSVGYKSLSALLRTHYCHYHLICIVDEEEIVFKDFIVCIPDYVQQLRQVEQHAWIRHYLLICNKAGENRKCHGLVHAWRATVWSVFTAQHTGQKGVANGLH